MRARAALSAVLLLAACADRPPPQAQTSAPAAAPLPLEREVFYQIFTRSMRDTNGDREGDLRGILQSLDYLKRLGVTSILLTPIYPSSFYHNYFASDFQGVDPEFGTMADYRALVEAVHARGMKLYLDQEFQYVAYDHPWFRSALGNPDSEYSPLLIFHGPGNTRPEEGPFGITIAKRFRDAETGITTVNMKAPEFAAWAERFLLGWVDPNGDGDFSDGVDGFRLDHMMDDLDNKGLLTDLFDSFWKPLFAKLKAVNPRLNLIAEQSDWGYGGDFLRRGGVDAAFAFPLAAAIRAFDKAKIVEALEKTAAATPPGKHQLVFAENHDMSRIASEPGITSEKLRAAATLAMLLRGVPLLYYGQEIGMRGRFRDAFKTDERDIGVREAFEWSAKVEAPGQAIWYRGPEVYWTERFAKDHDGISVEEQRSDPESLLNHYRRLLALRAANPAFTSDAQRVLPGPDEVLMVERGEGKGRAVLVANLSEEPARVPVPVAGGQDALGEAEVCGGELVLAPYETVVIVGN